MMMPGLSLELRRRRPGALVMGAHAHDPLHDLFATSLTPAVVAECAAPVFVAP